MSGPPRRLLEDALRDAGLEGVSVRRATGGYRVGFGPDDAQGFIAAGVVRHNVRQGTLSAFARAWAEASGLLPVAPHPLDIFSEALTDYILGDSRAGA